MYEQDAPGVLAEQMFWKTVFGVVVDMEVEVALDVTIAVVLWVVSHMAMPVCHVNLAVEVEMEVQWVLLQVVVS